MMKNSSTGLRFPKPTVDTHSLSAARIQSKQQEDELNRKCADCLEIGPTYVCVTLGTFVCSGCAGLHRELGHKVKSLYASQWTATEVEEVMKKGGNKADREQYMVLWSRTSSGDPPKNNIDGMRQFIKSKYVEMKWSSKGQIKAVDQMDLGFPSGPIKLDEFSFDVVGSGAATAPAIPNRQDDLFFSDFIPPPEWTVSATDSPGLLSQPEAPPEAASLDLL